VLFELLAVNHERRYVMVALKLIRTVRCLGIEHETKEMLDGGHSQERTKAEISDET